MRVGVIPFRQDEGRVQICLISSRSKPGQMTLPKGMARPGEGLEDAALREMREEAGLKGRILLRRMPLLNAPRKRPDESCIFYWCQVKKVMASWPEEGHRHRLWHSIGDEMDFTLTRNASKIYRELLKLGLDQGNHGMTTEGWLKQKLEQAGGRLMA